MSDNGHDKEAELIEEPTEVDVLCGRGGVFLSHFKGSNHNPGNAWYRRLIRSNRSLYRACPKHTKLLVSKAIVQAVQQQGGRFLEKDKQTNMFVQVPYKRAVDKTSQGLRERDRDDESDGTDDDEPAHGEEKKQSSKKRMVVPEEFSGRNKNPNMSDLATVAIGMIGRGNDSPKTTGDGSNGSNKRQKVQVVVGKKSRSNLLDDDDEEVDMKKSDGKRVENAIQIPPALHANQTSTFRLLNQPGILPPASSQGDATRPDVSPAFLPTFSQAFGLPQPPGVQTAVSQPFHPAVPGIYWVNPASQNPIAFLPVPMTDSAPPPLSRLTSQVSDWLTSFWPLAKESQEGNCQAASVPVGEGIPTSITNKLKIPAPCKEVPAAKSLPPSISEQLKIPVPCTDKPQINTLPPPPPKRIVHMQQQVQQKRQQAKAAEHQRAVSIGQQERSQSPNSTIPSSGSNQVVSQQQANLEAWQRFQAQQAAIQEQYEQNDYMTIDAAHSPPYHRETGRATMEASGSSRMNPTKTRAQDTVASHESFLAAYGGNTRLYNNGTSRTYRSTSVDDDDDDDDHIAAEPTELEHSVSATLLRLASGRLESGITTFFDRHQSIGVRMGDDTMEEDHSGTLLDDHQDTEAESRMRLM